METKTKLEIIKEVSERYNINTRSISATKKNFYNNSPMCVYTNEAGSHCAVGFYFKPLYKSVDFILNNRTLYDVYNSESTGIDHYLVEEVQGHDYNFWRHLQILHDNVQNWDDTGLSDTGKVYVKELEERYK